MKTRRLLPLFLSCQFLWACAPDATTGLVDLTSTSQALNAKPVDTETQLYRIQDGSDYFPLLQSNGQLFFLRNCDEQNIVESIGIPYDDNNYLHPENTHAIYSGFVLDLLASHGYTVQDVPEIKCNDSKASLRIATIDFEGDTDYEAWDVNDGDETDDDDEKKYFLKVRGNCDDDDYIIGYMIGCTAFIDALGLDRNSASTVNAEDYNIGDEYDINCFQGKVTQSAVCSGEKPEHSYWTSNNSIDVDPTTGEYLQEWNADARFWQPADDECEWACNDGLVVKNGLECVPPECTIGTWDESLEVCGCNGNGRKKKICANGLWQITETCLHPDECCNGDDKLISNTCGVNQDDPWRKKCEEGSWETYCAYEDNCTYGSYFRFDDVPCGYNGNGYFERKCPRAGEQSAGYIDPVAWECMTKEACEDAGWTFKDPDECRNGSTQTVNNCGLNFRDPKTRSCSGGQWSGWVCDYKDKCSINGEVYQIDSDIAEKSNLEPTCGLNLRGMNYAYCPDGQWAAHHCADTDVCVDDTSRHIGSCGYNGDGDLYERCTEGQWMGSTYCIDPDDCRNGSTRKVSCGTNKEREDRCYNGGWVEGLCLPKCDSDEHRCGFRCYPKNMQCP